MKITMSSPDLNDADRQAVIDVINTPILSMGKYTTDFEKTFCDLTGAKHAISVNSGTAGLHLCVRAAGIGAGDLVIATPFSFVAAIGADEWRLRPAMLDGEHVLLLEDGHCLREQALELVDAVRGLRSAFDPRHGGFGRAPKFPQPSQPQFLLRYAKRFNDAEAIRMVLHTCDRMAAGGIAASLRALLFLSRLLVHLFSKLMRYLGQFLAAFFDAVNIFILDGSFDLAKLGFDIRPLCLAYLIPVVLKRFFGSIY